MYRYDYQTWFTLNEIMDFSYGDQEPWSGTVQLGYFIDDQCNPSAAPIWTDYNSKTLKAHLEDLWKLIHARFYNWYCISVTYDPTSEEEGELTQEIVNEFLYRLINVIVLTYDKYATLLDYYTAQSANLMNQISTSNSGTVRFNDTPQDGGDFSDDAHTTNITQSSSTSTTDGNTPIMRLKEIQDNYRDAMEEWCNEFKRLFIPEEDITI